MYAEINSILFLTGVIATRGIFSYLSSNKISKIYIGLYNMHTDRNTDKCINALISFFLPFSAKKYPLPSLRADILSQSLIDSFGRGNFGIVVQVAVKICRYVVGGVSEPLLDLLHGNSACQKQAGTGMAQVMETDLFKVMLYF